MSNSNSKFGDLDRLIFGEDEFKLNSSNSSKALSESTNENELNNIKDHFFEDDNIDDGEVISLNHQVLEENLDHNNKDSDNIAVNNVSKIEPWQKLVQDELQEFSLEPIGKDYEVLASKESSLNLDLDEDFGIKEQDKSNYKQESVINKNIDDDDSKQVQVLSTDALGQTRNLVEQFKKIVGNNTDEKSKNIKTNHSHEKKFEEGNIENLIRPMISEWLNDNLPDIVKKIVLEEIKKIT